MGEKSPRPSESSQKDPMRTQLLTFAHIDRQCAIGEGGTVSGGCTAPLIVYRKIKLKNPPASMSENLMGDGTLVQNSR